MLPLPSSSTIWAMNRNRIEIDLKYYRYIDQRRGFSLTLLIISENVFRV